MRERETEEEEEEEMRGPRSSSGTIIIGNLFFFTVKKSNKKQPFSLEKSLWKFERSSSSSSTLTSLEMMAEQNEMDPFLKRYSLSALETYRKGPPSFAVTNFIRGKRKGGGPNLIPNPSKSHELTC